jgi:hypothetical protein
MPNFSTDITVVNLDNYELVSWVSFDKFNQF